MNATPYVECVVHLCARLERGILTGMTTYLPYLLYGHWDQAFAAGMLSRESFVNMYIGRELDWLAKFMKIKTPTTTTIFARPGSNVIWILLCTRSRGNVSKAKERSVDVYDGKTLPAVFMNFV